jgi:hypothetical protein
MAADNDGFDKTKAQPTVYHKERNGELRLTVTLENIIRGGKTHVSIMLILPIGFITFSIIVYTLLKFI